MGSVEMNWTNCQRAAFIAREAALIRFAAHIVVYCQMLCPVGLTGHLRRSIERGDVERGAYYIWVVARAAYSIYVERGTGRYAAEGRGRSDPWVYFNAALGRFIWTDGTRPQPFMNPGVDMAARTPI